MTREELAKKLDGCEVNNEIDGFTSSEAATCGLVVVFGHSDDLVEFEGAITDESDAYGGGRIYLTSGGLLENECDDEYCPYFKREKESARCIKANWSDVHGAPSWSFETDIPHSEFNILEDDGVYCRGIVFCMSDV